MGSNQNPLIVIMTDFGNDHYLGIIKGKILTINPNAKIISLTNQIKKHDIKHGAFVLKESYKHFPLKLIFLVIVDPGVGSSRSAIAAEKDGYYFIGPDNGILYPILTKNEIPHVFKIPIPEDASHTFHGRDVFAPAAAHLSLKFSLKEIGSPSNLETSLNIHRDPKGRLGEVVFIDTFGNIITNIPSSLNVIQSSNYIVKTDNFEKKMNYEESYFKGSTTSPFLTSSSFSTFEITIRNGKASDFVKLEPEDQIRIFPLHEKREKMDERLDSKESS